MNKNTKHLVTGGSGFIGSALVKRLVKEGYNVRVLDNNIRGVKARLDDVINQVEFIEADIRDFSKVNKACEGVDVIHHLAYINGTEYFYKMPETILEIAIKGIMNIIDACKNNNIRELYVASSSEVYQSPRKIPTSEGERLIVPDPMNPRYSYGGGKILWELLSINYGRKYFDKVIIYRPHNVYASDMGWEHVLPQFVMRLNKLIKEQKNNSIINFPIQGTGDETRSFIFIKDFIDGVVTLINKGEHLNIYNIGTENEISIKELAKLVAKSLGVKINIIPGRVNKGSTSRRCPDISKIKKLGFKPNISLEDGINNLAKWYSKNFKSEKKLNLKNNPQG